MWRGAEFIFTITGNNPSPAEFAVTEAVPPNLVSGTFIQLGSECVQDPPGGLRATGVIQAGETQECRFINNISD